MLWNSLIHPTHHVLQLLHREDLVIPAQYLNDTAQPWLNDTAQPWLNDTAQPWLSDTAQPWLSDTLCTPTLVCWSGCRVEGSHG